MHALIPTVSSPQPHLYVRLVLESFDCSDEFSFDHFAELRRIVAEDDVEVEVEEAELELHSSWN